MAVSPRGPSHIKQIETRSTTRRVEEMKKGEVFLREGTAHMKVDVADSPDAGKTWIVNLVTGSCWPVLNQEDVYSCTDIELSFKSTRC